MFPIDADFIFKFAPVYRSRLDLHAEQTRIVEGMSPYLPAVLQSYEIDTVDRIAHFLAQTCHESQGFSTVVEAGGAGYFDMYDNRNGNTQPGDGYRFRGRGLIQLTFRDNYERIGRALGADLVNQPDLVTSPHMYLLVSCEFWKESRLNSISDGPGDDDARIEAVTKVINGGLNGLQERKAYFMTIKPLLQQLTQAPVAPVPAPKTVPPPVSSVVTPPPAPSVIDAPVLPTLVYGSEGFAVRALESLLTARGYLMSGTFGVATQSAVKQFQQTHGLNPDGAVGPETWAKLLQKD